MFFSKISLTNFGTLQLKVSPLFKPFTLISFNLSLFKAFFPIFLTVGGITISSIPVPKKALYLIVRRFEPSSKLTSFKALQSLKQQ